MLTDEARKFITGVKDDHIFIMTSKKVIELRHDTKIYITWESNTGQEMLHLFA